MTVKDLVTDLTRDLTRDIVPQVPTPFLPPDLPNLNLWFDADDSATITESLDLVSKWDDKSPNSWHATQSISAQRPKTNTRTINGRNALLLDNFPNMEVLNNNAIDFPQTIFAVVEADALIGQHRIINRQAGPVNGDCILRWESTLDTSYFVQSTVQSGAGVASIPIGVPTLLVASCDITDGSFPKLALNDDPYTVGGTAVSSLNNTTSAVVRIGRKSDANSQYWRGTIGEIIVYNRVLSDIERGSVFQYLQNKWNL